MTTPSKSTSSSHQDETTRLAKFTPKALLTKLVHDDKVNDNQFRKLAILSGAHFTDLFEMNHHTKEAIPRTKRELLAHLQMLEEQKVLWVTPVLALFGMSGAIAWYLNASKVNKTIRKTIKNDKLDDNAHTQKTKKSGGVLNAFMTPNFITGVLGAISLPLASYLAAPGPSYRYEKSSTPGLAGLGSGSESTFAGVAANGLGGLGMAYVARQIEKLPDFFNNAVDTLASDVKKGKNGKLIKKKNADRALSYKRGFVAIVVLYFLQPLLINICNLVGSKVGSTVGSITSGGWSILSRMIGQDEHSRQQSTITHQKKKEIHAFKQKSKIEYEYKQKILEQEQRLKNKEFEFKERQFDEESEHRKQKLQHENEMMKIKIQQELFSVEFEQKKYDTHQQKQEKREQMWKDLRLKGTSTYNNVASQLKRFQTALYVLPATATIVMLYYQMCQKHTEKNVYHVLHNNYQKEVEYIPYQGNTLRNVDYTLHKMFLSSAKNDETVDALRYRIIQYHYRNFGSKKRLILLNHLVQPTGHILESPDQIARAIAKYQSTLMDLLSGRMFGRVVRNTLRTLGNMTGFRRRSSSHSWLKTKTKRNITKARTRSSSRRMSTKSSSSSGSRTKRRTTYTGEKPS